MALYTGGPKHQTAVSNLCLPMIVSDCRKRRINSKNVFSVYIHLVTCLLTVVDLLEEDGARGKEVAQFGQIDPVPEPLLQLCGGWHLFVQTGLHPPVKKCTGNSHYTGHSEGTLLIVLLIIHDADDKTMFVL